jgi:proteasome assembly chaperone 2
MSDSIIWTFWVDSDISGYTLIIPSVAVGNVGQLACDLLISSLDMIKIASVYSAAFIPVLGYDPYDLNSSQLSSCCEIYKSTSRNLIVLQLRAPLVFKYARTFLEDVVLKFKERNIKDIVILTSSFAHEKKHITSSPFRYIANESCLHKSKVQKLTWMEHESLDTGLKIFGGGFASLLYAITSQQSLPCLILYKYCSEGNNIPDAYEMVHYLAKLIPIFSENKDLVSQLVQPASWKLMFGRPPPRDIY